MITIKQKKSQMEVLGLAFVVILIMLGLFFIVILDANKEVSTQRTDFMFKQRASNMINSIIHSSTKDCNNNKIEDLMRDCANGGTVICDNGENSCEYVNSTLEYIFNQTLDIWVPTGYAFNVSSESGMHTYIMKPDRVTGRSCSRNYTGENSLFPIPLDPGYLYVNIYLCK
ncbi:hypothetical protein K9M79_02390 [Candidatus Woesearchaeota archaeon]|nr:hypothetical protein [Candidatus Woesearchaeota archaeon]